MKLFPVAKSVPPEALEYQFTMPVLEVAFSVKLPEPHTGVMIELVIVGMVMIVLVAIKIVGSPGIPPYSTM